MSEFKVVQFMRKPEVGHFSMERLFQDVRNSFSADVEVVTYRCPFKSQGVWRRIFSAFRSALNQGDVNHVTGDVHFLSIFMRRSRTILTIHDCVTLERLSGFRYRIFWFLWYWLPAKRSKVITVISESTKQELESHLGHDNWPIVVIPDPVSPAFRGIPKAFNSECPVLLQIGTKKNKNIENVAASLAGIRCHLVIVGKLSLEQKDILDQHRVPYECHVNVSDQRIIELYESCDIVMFASLYEGFGLPILEAQAVGRPVITSNLYSMPEVGGGGACYINPYDVSSIRTAVEEIIESEAFRAKLVAAGFRNVQNYKASAIAEKYTALYRQVYESSK